MNPIDIINITKIQDKESSWYWIPDKQLNEFELLIQSMPQTYMENPDLFDSFNERFSNFRTEGDKNIMPYFYESMVNEGYSEAGDFEEYKKSKMFLMKTCIKKKFGTLKNFYKVSGISESFYRTTFTRLKGRTLIRYRINQIWYAVVNLNPSKVVKKTITKRDINVIKLYISENYKNVSHFCSEHKSFTPMYLSRILRGKRKQRNERFKKLWNIVVSEK